MPDRVRRGCKNKIALILPNLYHFRVISVFLFGIDVHLRPKLEVRQVVVCICVKTLIVINLIIRLHYQLLLL